MKRIERSKIRRRRRALAAFSFLLCFLIFSLGIYMTNEVMKKTLSIDDDRLAISLPINGQAIMNKISKASLEKKKEELKDKVEDIHETLKELLRGITS